MQSAGDRLLPLGTCPRDLGCSHRWNDGDEGAYGSHPMTFQMGLYRCEANSLQKYSSLCEGVRRRERMQVEGGGPEGKGSAPRAWCNCGLNGREGRAGRHVSHAPLT